MIEFGILGRSGNDWVENSIVRVHEFDCFSCLNNKVLW